MEPGNLFSVPQVDPADLEAWLRPYLGQEQPQWAPHYVHVGANVVLLVIVEPPRWGDPIYCLHRTYKNYPEGTIFVRRLAKTVSPPSPEELAYLQERVGRRADQFRLEVAWTEPAAVSVVDFCPEELQDWADNERRELLAPLEKRLARKVTRPAEESSERKGISLERLKQVDLDALTMKDVEQLDERARKGEELSQVEREQLEAARLRMGPLIEKTFGRGLALGLQPEDRSPDNYRSEVDAYLQEARDVAFRWQTSAAARSGLVQVHPRVNNPTRRNFTSVLLDMEIARSVWAVNARLAEEGSDLSLPARPRLWGVARPLSYSTRHILGSDLSVNLSPVTEVRPQIETDDGPPYRIRWHVGDLRPHEQVELAPVCLFVAPQHAGDSLEVHWSATAKDAEGVAAGLLGIEVNATPFKASIAELIQRLGGP